MARLHLSTLSLALLASAALGCSSEPASGAPAADAAPADAAAAADGADAAAPDAPAPDAGPAAPRYADWMAELLAAYPERAVTLADLAFPRAHDAGTYTLTTCSLGAIACNTQTQRLTMAELLEVGVRGFDVRPVLNDDGAYFSHHTNSCHGAGCEGDAIASMLAQTRAFVDAHAELVILELGHFCSTGADDPAFLALVEDSLGDRLYRELTPDPTPFIARPLREVIAPEDGLGKVLVLYSGLADTAANRAAGRFASSFVPREGGWSNKQLRDEMVADQLQRWGAFDADGSALFELSWTLTMDTDLAVACLTEEAPRSIESMAAEANDVLASELEGLIAAGAIAKGRIPHILSVDYADTFVTEQALRLSRLNLD